MNEIIKEGAVAVRGHFLWRERFVVIKKGEVLIFRRRDGSVKAKVDSPHGLVAKVGFFLILTPNRSLLCVQINLLDAKGVKVTFHSENSYITLSTQGKDVVFDCHTTPCRDSWLSALFTARGQFEEVDTESDLILSGDDSDLNDSSRHHHRRSEKEEPADVDETEDDDEYSDALLAFQDVRSSMIQCHLTMNMAKEDLFVAPDASLLGKHHHIHATRTEEALRLKCIRSLLVFIESSPHGGRVILLHLGVLASAGIKVEDILLALGEKQQEKPRRSSFTSTTISMHKLYAATFVRDMIFHPIYSKRPEVKTEQVNDIIDRYFSHCRLRRFSHDDEHMMMSVHPIGLELTTHAAASNGPRKPHPATMSKAEMLLKKKRHSFPNILTPLRIRAGLLDSSKLDELLTSSQQAAAATASSATKNASSSQDSDEDDVSLLENRPTSTSSTDSDLFHDESIPEPLQSLLWRSSCHEIAEQITIFHHKQISRLCLWDFLHNPREAAKEISENFNRLVSYFVWSVLVEDAAKDRAEAIENIISIALAASSIELNNFHLVMACVGCLGDTPLMVSRLPTTWKKVRPKFKTHLQELRTLCDHSGGFENLRKRQAIVSVKGSCIPFIGVIGVALERLRSTNYFNDRKLLDFEKLERQYATLNVLENGIQKPYKIKSIDQMHKFLTTLSLDFVTPRLLQLRSQQILAFENANSSRHSSFLLPQSSSSSSGGDSSESSNALAPFLSFRNICSTLVTVSQPHERIQICLEALFADDKQLLSRQLRKFWVEFKQNVWVSACHLAVLGVRNCIDALVRDVLATKATELQQISSLDENAKELHGAVYEKLVTIVTQPIFTWLFAKVKYAFANEDARIHSYIQNSSQSGQRGDQQPALHMSAMAEQSCSSPMQLVLTIAHYAETGSSLDAASASPTQLLTSLLQNNSQIASHPFSALYALQQLLDVVYLPRRLRDGINALETAIAHVQRSTSTSE